MSRICDKKGEVPTIVYEVLRGEMARSGITFYRAANGVWLTKTVPPQYLRKI